MSFQKIRDTAVEIIRNLPNRPTGTGHMTAAALKMAFDQAAENIKKCFNDLIDELGSDEAAENIGFMRSNSVPADTVQDAIENVQGQIAGVSQGAVADNSITTAKLQDGAVVEGKIGNLAVTTDKIQRSAVTEGKIASDAVTSDKIKNSAVTTDKIYSKAVTNAKLADEVKNAFKQTSLGNAEVEMIHMTDLPGGWSPWWKIHSEKEIKIGNDPGVTFFEIVLREDQNRAMGPGCTGYIWFTGNAANKPASGYAINVTAHPEGRYLTPTAGGANYDDVYDFIDVDGSEVYESKPVIAINIRENSAANREITGIVVTGFYICEGAT